MPQRQAGRPGAELQAHTELPFVEDLDELRGLLKPAKKGTLERYPVRKDMGKVTNNGKYLLEPNSE